MSFAGAQFIHDTPSVFNRLGELSGVEKNIVFEDLSNHLACIKAGALLDALPKYRAVILASESKLDSIVAFPQNTPVDYIEVEDSAVGVITFEPSIKHILDVLTFLHATLNVGVEKDLKASSILAKGKEACVHLPKKDRTESLRKAVSFSQAYDRAVKTTATRAPVTLPVTKIDPKIAASTALAKSFGFRVPNKTALMMRIQEQALLLRAPKPALTNRTPPIFVVFVEGPATGEVVAILSDRVFKVPATSQADRPEDTVLCRPVVDILDKLSVDGSPMSTIIFGLAADRF